MFLNNPRVKVTVGFVCKLLGLQHVHYHAIYTENYRVYFQQLFLGQNLSRCLYLRFIIYHAIYIEFFGISLQQKKILVQNYHKVCM